MLRSGEIVWCESQACEGYEKRVVGDTEGSILGALGYYDACVTGGYLINLIVLGGRSWLWQLLS